MSNVVLIINKITLELNNNEIMKTVSQTSKVRFLLNTAFTLICTEANQGMLTSYRGTPRDSCNIAFSFYDFIFSFHCFPFQRNNVLVLNRSRCHFPV